ncbi:MAG: hypothetical protein AABX93_01160 [Nanoarchaeota archaeon]
MAKAKNLDFVGKWAFLAGVILAVGVGVMNPAGEVWTMALVAIGLVVGLLNVTGREVTSFLMSGAVLIIASALGGNVMSAIPYVGPVFQALLTIFVPATIIVAVRNVFNLARN